MNHEEFIRSLQGRGLRSWQANFVGSFLETDSAPFHLLTAPPGTGKSYTSLAIAGELAARGAKRMLVLPPAPLCEEWRVRLGNTQSKLPVVRVTRQIYRELEAAVPIGESPLNSDGIYVISQDLLKASDVFNTVTSLDWDLVVVDEAHRMIKRPRTAGSNSRSAATVTVRPIATLEHLLANDGIRRLLLLTATPFPTLELGLPPSPDQPEQLLSNLVVTNWNDILKNGNRDEVDGQRLEWISVSYIRHSDEVKYLSDVLGLMPMLKSAGDGTWDLTQALIQRAASSLYAVEQTLRRLESSLRMKIIFDNKLRIVEQNLEAVGDILNSALEGTDSIIDETSTSISGLNSDSEDINAMFSKGPIEWADLLGGAGVVQKCLEMLDLVSADEKVNTLQVLVQSVTDAQAGRIPSICVISRYADTVSYLHTALEEIGLPLHKLTGEMSFTERSTTVERFLREGGLMLATDAALPEGISMSQVAHVVHFDPPTNSLVLAKRCGRFDRYGRAIPLTMYLLKDESGVLPLEARLIERIVLNQDFDTEELEGPAVQ